MLEDHCRVKLHQRPQCTLENLPFGAFDVDLDQTRRRIGVNEIVEPPESDRYFFQVRFKVTW